VNGLRVRQLEREEMTARSVATGVTNGASQMAAPARGRSGAEQILQRQHVIADRGTVSPIASIR
jgi:hypothetical protein